MDSLLIRLAKPQKRSKPLQIKHDGQFLRWHHLNVNSRRYVPPPPFFETVKSQLE